MCCCNNTTEQFPKSIGDDTFSQHILVAQLSIFALVFVLGILGNVIVIATIFTQKRLRTSSHYFIANLAVSDLGGLCLSMPLAALNHVVDWPFGEVACRLINPLKDLFLHVSIITLTAIAVDRYLHIAHPFRTSLSIYKSKLIIALIWLVDYLLIPLPMALVMTVHTTVSGVRYCVPRWSAEHRRVARVCLASVILLFMCVTAVSYLRVAVAMKQQRQRIVERAQASGFQEKVYRKQLEKNIKTVKAMVVIVVVFCVSALPLIFFGLLFEFDAVRLSPHQTVFTIFIIITLLFLQNCANPIILCVMSKEMRAGFAACVRCRRRRRQNGKTYFSQPRSHTAVNGSSKSDDENSTHVIRGVQV